MSCVVDLRDECFLGMKDVVKYIRDTKTFLKHASAGGCPVAAALIEKADKILEYHIFKDS